MFKNITHDTHLMMFGSRIHMHHKKYIAKNLSHRNWCQNCDAV